jgi:hypothetical protein
VYELAIALQLLAVTICKCSINPITNPNYIYSHAYVTILNKKRYMRTGGPPVRGLGKGLTTPHHKMTKMNLRGIGQGGID